MKSARKKHFQEVLSLSSKKMKKAPKPSPTLEIAFSSLDLEGIVPGHNDLMVISAVMVNAEVKNGLRGPK